MEFVPFDKIEQLKRAAMNITQKIHGSNAQIYVFDNNGTLDLKCGSRNRWITPDNDNFGFARFVHDNKDAFLTLGLGRHYGEWAGPGINSGEGLKEKRFCLFDFWKYPPERPMPPQTVPVPVLYQGPFDLGKVDECMNDLKTNGSKLVPGFMRPEGIVIMALQTRFKRTFEQEDSAWKDRGTPKLVIPKVDCSHLLQPLRLEKLLSKDEAYTRDYPANLGKIVTDYLDDLVAEGQITGTTDEILVMRKAAGRQVFPFVKEIMSITK